jgi:hypothetical protein
MLLSGKALKSNVLWIFVSPILPYDFKVIFWGRVSGDIPAHPDPAGCCVPKTLELGTTVFRAGIR